MSSVYSQVLQSTFLPAVSLMTKAKFWQIYRQFQKNPQSLFDPPSDTQWKEVKNVLTRAYRHVPFYQERMNALGLSPDAFQSFNDWHKLPPTTKADISAHFPDRITSDERLHEPWRYVSTSGTTGRLTVIHDFLKRDYCRAMLLYALNAATGYEPGMKYLDIPPDMCANVCGTSSTREPGITAFLWEKIKEGKLLEPKSVSEFRGLVDRQILHRQLQLTSFGSEGLKQSPQKLDMYLKNIADYKPYIVRGLSAYLYVLAVHILKNNIRPPEIKGGLIPMGSSMTPVMRKTVQKAFDCKVHETYGSAELGAIAAECGHQKGLHGFSALFYIEVVRKGQPAADGEIGRILITDLVNTAMPLLRYDIGDVALVKKGKCACGVNSGRIEIQGRLQDCLMGRDGQILTSDRITDEILGNFTEVLGFQLEVRDDDQHFLQVVPVGENVSDVEKIATHVSGLLEGNPGIQTRVVPTIMPEQGGKYRFVKNLRKQTVEI